MKNALIIVLFSFASLVHSGPYPKSDHYDGSRFFMPNGVGLKSFWDVIKWKWETDPSKWPEEVANSNYKLPKLEAGKGIVTFINHATFLVQLPGLTILTDPIFSQRAGPFESFGPVKRVRPPGLDLELLPPVDVVLISHNHYDHLDLDSLKKIDARFRPLFLVPLGDEMLLKDEGLQNVREMDWWSEQKVKESIITFTPVQHWSARGLFDKNKSLWGGHFISTPELRIYFAGDTGYTPYFLETRKRLGSPDIALLPIGAYGPRWFMREIHMNPEDAVMAHMDLEAGVSFGMHFGTFQLSDEAYDAPLKDLKMAREKYRVPEDKFRVLDFGESWSF